MVKRILLIGTGSPTFRSYILEHLIQGGFTLYLAGDRPERWRQYAADFLDISGLADPIDAIVAFGKRNGVAGAVTYSEEHVLLTARVCMALGLRHTDPDVLVRFRDKYLMRRALAEHHVTTMACHLAENPEDAVRLARLIGFPVVVKPTIGHSSIGVVKAHNEQEVRAAAADLLSYQFEARAPGIIVEEYLDGPEVTMECFVENGQPTVVAVVDKQLSAEPYFEEINHTVPSALPPAAQHLLVSMAVRAVKALGMENGTAGIEARFTSRGPRVLEIAARLQGDFIPEIIRLATGINLPVIAACIACGIPVNIDRLHDGAAAVAFLVPPREGTIRSGLTPAQPLSNVVQINYWGQAGQAVCLPPRHYLTRLGYVITTAPTPHEAHTAALAALDAVQLVVE